MLGNGPDAELGEAQAEGAAPPQATATLAPDVVAAAAPLVAVQARYDGVSDLKARFEQRARVASLRRDEVSAGRVWVKRPGRMRWEYETPEPHVIATDGELLRLYSPGEGQVQIAPLAQGTFSPTALDFLLGEGDLAETFVARRLEDTERGEIRLQLVPRSEARFQAIELWLAPDSHQLRGSVLMDLLGNRTQLRFLEIVENQGVADERFQVEVPEGTEVIDLR